MTTTDRETALPKAVVVVAPLPPPLHGAAATTQGILDFLTPRFTLHLANMSPGRASGVRRHFVRSWRMLKGVALLVAKCRSRDPVLYMTADGGAGMIYNIAVALTGTLLGYRVFLHHHSFAYIDRRTWLMTILSRILARRGTHVVLCPAMVDGLESLYEIGATLELSSAALLPPSARRLRRTDGPLRMGFLSNLIVEKGLDTSIDLLRAALAEGLPVELQIAGRAPDQRPLDLIAAATAELGVALTYLGPLSDAEKENFLGDLDVFLFPSRYFNEAQPRAVLEALAHGVPVLTIARSCITTDMGRGAGLCAVRTQDFVPQALPYVRAWAENRALLADVSDRATTRGTTLHQTGLAHLEMLANAFDAPPKA